MGAHAMAAAFACVALKACGAAGAVQWVAASAGLMNAEARGGFVHHVGYNNIIIKQLWSLP